MEIEAKSLFQINRPFVLNSDVKLFLQYICWLNLALFFIIKCLLAAKQFKEDNNIHDLDSLCIAYLYVAYLSYFTLYHVKDIFIILKLCFLNIILYIFILFSLLSLHIF